MFQDLAMELYRKDTSCIEVLLHPSLRTLEVIATPHLLLAPTGALIVIVCHYWSAIFKILMISYDIYGIYDT